MGDKYIIASPNEEVLLSVATNKDKRKQRLLQVRQQDKENSLKMLQTIKRHKDVKLKMKMLECQTEKGNERDRIDSHLLKELQQRYKEIGGAHQLDGKESVGVKRGLSKFSQQRSATRYQQAIEKIKKQQEEDNMAQENQNILRSRIQTMEKDRLSAILSKPVHKSDPIDALKCVRYVAASSSKLCKVDSFLSTRYHLGRETIADFVVEKVCEGDQIDAKRAADEESERLRLLKQRNTCEVIEREEKAQLRHLYAQQQVHMQQKKDTLLQELQQLEFENRNRRRKVVADIPKKVFQPPYQREKQLKSKQYELEQVFERLHDLKRDDVLEKYYQDDVPEEEHLSGKENSKENPDATSLENNCLSEKTTRSIKSVKEKNSQIKTDHVIADHVKLQSLRQRIKTQKERKERHVSLQSDSPSVTAMISQQDTPVTMQSAHKTECSESIDSVQPSPGKNTLSKQNVMLNERLLEHQTRIMELQLRHLQNNKINHKVLSDANQQLHVVVPHSVETISRGRMVSDPLHTEENTPSNFECLSTQNSELVTSYEVSGSNVSLSLSNVTIQHEHMHVEVETTDKGIDQFSLDNKVRLSAPTAIGIPTINAPTITKPVGTQKDNVEEKEVAVQTSAFFDTILTCSSSSEHAEPGKDEMNQLSQRDHQSIIENKIDHLRSKYPNIFDETHCKEASAILHHMFSEEENDDNILITSEKTPSHFNLSSSIYNKVISPVDTSMKNDIIPIDINVEDDIIPVDINVEDDIIPVDINVEDDIPITINITGVRGDGISVDRNTPDAVGLRIENKSSDTTKQTSEQIVDAENNFYSSGFTEDTNKTSLSSVTNVLNELKNLQLCVDDKTRNIVHSGEEYEFVADDSSNISHIHATPDNNRLARVSEYPDVSPIKEVEESILNSKHTSLRSLQEQSISNESNDNIVTDSLKYEQDGLSLVRASSKTSTQHDDVFLPLHKEGNVRQVFHKGDNVTMFSGNQSSHNFHSLKEQKLYSSSTDGTLDFQEENENVCPMENITSSFHSMTSSPPSLTSLSQSPISATSLLNPSTMFEILKEHSAGARDNHNIEKKSLVHTVDNNLSPTNFLSSESRRSSGSTSEKYQQLLERVKQLPLLHAHEQKLLLESYEKSKATISSPYARYAGNDTQFHVTADIESKQLNVNNPVVIDSNFEYSKTHLNTEDDPNMKLNELKSDYFNFDTVQDNSMHDFTVIDTLSNHVNDVGCEESDTAYNTPSPVFFSRPYSDRQTPSSTVSQEHVNVSSSNKNTPLQCLDDLSRKGTVDERNKFFMSYFHDTTPDLTSCLTRQSDDNASDLYSILTEPQDTFLPLPTGKSCNDKPLHAFDKAESYGRDLTQVSLGQFSNSLRPRTRCSTSETSFDDPKYINVASVATSNNNGCNIQSLSSDRTLSELMNLCSSGNSFQNMNELGTDFSLSPSSVHLSSFLSISPADNKFQHMTAEQTSEINGRSDCVISTATSTLVGDVFGNEIADEDQKDF